MFFPVLGKKFRRARRPRVKVEVSSRLDDAGRPAPAAEDRRAAFIENGVFGLRRASRQIQRQQRNF
jgi:hypothetical protein